MFMGIIEFVGKIVNMEFCGGDMWLCINIYKLDLGDVKLGDSIVVNGVCFIVIQLFGDGFWVDVFLEILVYISFK